MTRIAAPFPRVRENGTFVVLFIEDAEKFTRSLMDLYEQANKLDDNITSLQVEGCMSKYGLSASCTSTSPFTDKLLSDPEDDINEWFPSDLVLPVVCDDDDIAMRIEEHQVTFSIGSAEDDDYDEVVLWFEHYLEVA